MSNGFSKISESRSDGIDNALIRGFCISKVEPLSGELSELHKSVLNESADILYLKEGEPALIRVWESCSRVPKHTLRTSPVKSFISSRSGEITIRTLNTVYTLSKL